MCFLDQQTSMVSVLLIVLVLALVATLFIAFALPQIQKGTSTSTSTSQSTSTTAGSTSTSSGGGTSTSTGATAWVTLAKQQGNKLIGSGTVGGVAMQGASVCLAGDGNTAVIGGPSDNTGVGAVWVFTRTGTSWSQAGLKLTGTGPMAPVGAARQGTSVAISSDGSTILAGGPEDNGYTGATWVYAKSIAGVWVQQDKIVAPDAAGLANQGCAVSLSGNGNTALIGGRTDDAQRGSAWIYTRSGVVWTKQAKLIPVGISGTAVYAGTSVSLSSDGNTALIGAPNDGSNVGAAFVFTRDSGGVWTQQGDKITPGGTGGLPNFGHSVALNADATTAAIGGPMDSANLGATWIFVRNGTLWSQQGAKLMGSGVVGDISHQGRSVAINSAGNIVLIGGPTDNSYLGASWIWTRNSAGVWQQSITKAVGSGYVHNQPYSINGVLQGSSVSLSSNGLTALVGGSHDNTSVGASWVFVP